MEISGKKILVTGGAGFLGSHLVERLANGNDVRVLDDLSAGSLDNLKEILGKISFIKGSVLDKRLVKEIVSDVEIVFHLAAKVNVRESFENPVLYANVNTGGTATMLENCKHGVRFVFVSSAAVYGDNGNRPVKENSIIKPLSPYGISKQNAEWLCQFYHNSYRIPTIVLRMFNIYGVRQTATGYAGVIPTFIKNAKNKMPLKIYGDGKQTRDFLWVDDAVEALVLAAIEDLAIGDTFNVGCGKSVTINEVAEIVHHLSGGKVIHEKHIEEEIIHSKADISKAESILGYSSKTSVDKGIDYLWSLDV